LGNALAEPFQEMIAALQNGFEKVPLRHGFNCRQPRTGMGDVRTQHLGIVRKDLTAFAATRNTDLKLFLIDGGQRTRRGDQQNLIHRLALGGV
jgi:hypothetical protein